MKKDVFITSTLKSEWNREFNPILCKKIEEKWIKVHLPQRDTLQKWTELDKFNQNIEWINNSKKVIAIWNNESINRWLEVGYSFGKNKDIILLINKNHTIPTMSLGMFSDIIEAEELEDIDLYIDDLVKIIIEQ